MMKKTLHQILGLFGTTVLCSCGYEVSKASHITLSSETSPATTLAKQAAIQDLNSAFFQYKGLISTEQSGNLIYSPYSTSAAFSLLYPGTEGASRKAMRNFFGFPADLNQFGQERQALQQSLSSTPEGLAANDTYKINIVNDVWADEGVTLKIPFTNLLQQYLNAKVRKLDFRGATEWSRMQINDYIANQTNQRIKNLLPQGAVDSSTATVLTNAIYFLGDWTTQFPPENTRKENFNVEGSGNVLVDTMSVSGTFDYLSEKSFQAVSLPYVGNKLSMLFVIPRTGTLSQLEQQMDTTLFTKIADGLKRTELMVSLPKFTFADQKALILNDPLQNAGLQSIFCDQKEVNLSAMMEGSGSCVSTVIQKAFIKVDEKGTEAAAATAIVVTKSSVMFLDRVKVDRSSLFMIYDQTTRDILFMGRLIKP